MAAAEGRVRLNLPPATVELIGGANGLRRICWCFAAEQAPPADGERPHAVLDRAAQALSAYMAHPGRPLPPVPLAAPEATPFRCRVWAAIRAIPPGEVRTYGELARALGSSARAVGQATGANPWPVLVPCHRVVAAQGLGGYVGWHAPGRAVKRWLLRHEEGKT
ncbi:MAG TPA: methylated-DNA--[protein]-cysteine S-methyltransferase [Gammaproteobacteria bacterium]|nr:methylated-DNA--[protein]-cysteine S-methyltransferase [Gammaproteobacteria bacterium]